MSLRSNQLHLIGAIGYLLSVLLTMISLILMNSYYVSTAAIIVISICSMLSTCLVLIYFFHIATISKDTMIKAGGFLAGGGYGVLLLMALFQMMGVIIPTISYCLSTVNGFCFL